MATSKRLAQVAKTALVLPFLLAVLLALGLHVNAASHATINTRSHHWMAVDAPPPGH